MLDEKDLEFISKTVRIKYTNDISTRLNYILECS